ncbi:ATP-binding protein [Clostridium saccharoperbutylacetonicum]
MNLEFEQISKTSIMINSLCIFTNIKENNVIRKYKALLKYIEKDKISAEKAINLYNDFIYSLLDVRSDTCFKKFIIDILFLDSNPFTRIIDNNNLDNVSILNQVKFELEALEYIANIKSSNIKEAIISKSKAKTFQIDIIQSLIDLKLEDDEAESEKAINKLKKRIVSNNNWAQYLDEIISFYNQYGTGEFGEYRAFVWEHENDRKYLRGIKTPDPVRLQDLAGYEDQKETIISNTKQFLKGYPANNILLYGSRGTGKSSTVKAIINEFYNEGLRLIEVDKSKLVDFTRIIRMLKDKKLKFIIFVDDLVFEEGEASYSALKTILEGGVENRSNNILIYATTNRKHLVKETFSERSGDDIHANDAIEEKLSLADRFGMTVSFYSPDQKEYLTIVDNIAKARGLEVDIEHLHKEALKWVRWYNARSPRTAVQFINWFIGEMN